MIQITEHGAGTVIFDSLVIYQTNYRLHKHSQYILYIAYKIMNDGKKTLCLKFLTVYNKCYMGLL